ncbi:MAG: TraB/GumN family protein, partial [Phenylobacterium sp.]
ALMLSMQPALAHGARVQAGADLVVTRQARAGGKQIRTFETLEDQARMFASLPEPAELQYLTDVIHERHPGPARRLRLSLNPNSASLEQAWLAGDLARLGPSLVRDLAHDNPALYDVLLKRRNLAWADKLSAEMGAAPGVELVNVGALHMVGPDGLPALLAARGFKVERVQ